ncbi:uncharacterized protein LOC111130574 [Crassostrea virginica]
MRRLNASVRTPHRASLKNSRFPPQTCPICLLDSASPLASSPWQTMDNHEVMQIMVADLDSHSSTKKDKEHWAKVDLYMYTVKVVLGGFIHLLLFVLNSFILLRSDAGYITFRVAANRLGVFMEDPLTSDFIERDRLHTFRVTVNNEGPMDSRLH